MDERVREERDGRNAGPNEVATRPDDGGAPEGRRAPKRSKRWPLVVGVVVVVLVAAGAGFWVWHEQPSFAASAEQLALRADDPWAVEVVADPAAKAEGTLADGVYTGTGKGMEGLVTVKLLVDDNRITCLETTQEGESQSRGGYEAIRDGKFAAMIEAAQGSDIDAVTGATITTAAVRTAVDDALAQAEAAAAGAATTGEGEQR
ncbi:FMN-binding protein [Gordonibacter sp.]|uniref:FMN-binding protein n=1 Tax=Gordonibacter sp. TaxID=1968902 RepID=UPI0025C4EB6E|nr:FMN-binding protein [Gordonibacter sp.]